MYIYTLVLFNFLKCYFTSESTVSSMESKFLVFYMNATIVREVRVADGRWKLGEVSGEQRKQRE